MIATVILGVIIAVIFGIGIYNIYSNFFKGTSTCCKSECSSCSMCKVQGNYKTRVEAIEKFKIKKTIDVDGMTCENCTAAVTKALEKVEGVVIAAASVEKQSAQAALDREIADDVLKDAIRKAGYNPGNIFVLN